MIKSDFDIPVSIDSYKADVIAEALKSGADLAGIILADCGYSEEDIALIVDAIRNHRSNHVDNTQNTLGDILYIADKAARQCFDCTAQKECNWSMEKRNMEVYI